MNYDLLYKIHLNGIEAMHIPSRIKKAHNTSYFDAKRAELSKLAITLYGNMVPRLVRHFMENHMRDELKHGAVFESEKDEHADRILGYCERVLREHGLISYFACANLFEERIAVAEAVLGYTDDPHMKGDGFTDEFYHVTTPLMLIPMLNPSDTQLSQALADQERFFEEIYNMAVPRSPWAGYFMQ